MGAVVLALFGLAIRETVTTSAERRDEPDPDSYAVGMAQSEEEVRAAKLEAERQRFENQLAATRTLFGAEVATLGLLFDGVSLGRNRSTISAAVDASMKAFETRTGSTVQFGPFQGDAIGSVTIQLFGSLDSTERDRSCLWLDRQLQAVWGSGEPGVDGTEIWTNHATHHRSSFSTGYQGCTLVFERFLEPEGWLARFSPLIGQSVETAVASTGGFVDERSIAWEIDGLGTGTANTRVRATIDNRRVSRIYASTYATPRTQTQLIEALITIYGQPKRGGTNRPSTVLTWTRGNTQLEIDDDNVLQLTIGMP
jgi:hypothetical protein